LPKRQIAAARANNNFSFHGLNLAIKR